MQTHNADSESNQRFVSGGIDLGKPRLDYKSSLLVLYSYVFCDTVHQWFLDNNIDYELSYIDKEKTRISFKNKEDALLFKLTWG